MIFLLQAKCKGPLRALLLYQEDAAALSHQVHTAGAQSMSAHSLQESLMSILILDRWDQNKLAEYRTAFQAVLGILCVIFCTGKHLHFHDGVNICIVPVIWTLN